MKGLVFDIKHFALHDGPGIRQTIFFKACPLRCQWCHNPESRKSGIETFQIEKKLGSDKFVIQEQIGKWYEPDELMYIIQKDIPFFDQSGGGVTFSGGEPMMQFEFIKTISAQCKFMHIHTLVDTCGFTDYKNFSELNPFIDLYYYDIKHVNEEKMLKYVGVKPDLILQNLRMLIHDKKDVVVRIPLIPGFNDDEIDVREIIQALSKLEIKEIHLLPYHDIGKSKFKRFNITQDFEIENKPIDLISILSLYKNAGFNVKLEN